MPSNSPISLSLPPFRGAVRRIVLAGVVCFFLALVLSRTPLYGGLVDWFALFPARVWRAPWQLFTYPFLPNSLLGTLFALFSIWTFGAGIEDERGSRWFYEYFFVSAAGGGLLASLLALTPLLGPSGNAAAGIYTVGLWPAVIALILAFARFHPDETLTFNFLIRIKAKYLAAVYLLVYLAMALAGGDRFGAATVVCACAAGFAYMRLLPRRGLGFAASEQMYSVRNAWTRAKRRRAAKKFTVYMREQGRDVNIDSSGRYIDPDDPRSGRDPNDKRWMN